MKKINWYALYSQTGSEIDTISRTLGVSPTFVITDNHMGPIDNLGRYTQLICMNRETVEHKLLYLAAKDDIVTLHGYKRIISARTVMTLLERGVKLFNGHPGAIDLYPELKGLDPQRRAIEEGYTTVGCVIHKVTPELDGGQIVMAKHIKVEPNDLATYEKLHTLMTNMWIEFLSKGENDVRQAR